MVVPRYGSIPASWVRMSDQSPDDEYRGPTAVGHFKVPGRGTSYSMSIDGHDIQVWITEKRKLVRVYVDHKEWAEA